MNLDFTFHSPDHVRYENNKLISGPTGGAGRVVKVEPNPSGFGSLVSIFNLDGVHPLWQDNLTMAPKQMKVMEETTDRVVLRGWGNDAMGSSFADYGITINFKNGKILNCILHMYDRSVDIKYLSKEELSSELKLDINATTQGTKNGLVKEKKVNGETSEYNYIDGKKNGQWKVYFSSGKLKEVGNAVEDDSHGQWKAYYEDGTLRAEGQYVKSNMHGAFKFYDEVGTLRAEGTYSNGQQVGKWTYYDMFGKVEGTDNF